MDLAEHLSSLRVKPSAQPVNEPEEQEHGPGVYVERQTCPFGKGATATENPRNAGLIRLVLNGKHFSGRKVGNAVMVNFVHCNHAFAASLRYETQLHDVIGLRYGNPSRAAS